MDPHVHCPLLHTEDWLFKAGTGHSQGTTWLLPTPSMSSSRRGGWLPCRHTYSRFLCMAFKCWECFSASLEVQITPPLLQGVMPSE